MSRVFSRIYYSNINFFVSEFSDKDIQGFLNIYWKFPSKNNGIISSAPEGNFTCFKLFQKKIAASNDLKLCMLINLLKHTSVHEIISDKQASWFFALASSGLISTAVEPHNCRLLADYRREAKKSPNSLFAAMFAYVELHYVSVENSLAHEVNFRDTENSFQSQTGKDLTRYASSVPCSKRNIAAAEFFECSADQEADIQEFWRNFTTVSASRKSFVGKFYNKPAAPAPSRAEVNKLGTELSASKNVNGNGRN